MGTSILILVKDLLLSSRITTAAKSANIPFTVVGVLATNGNNEVVIRVQFQLIL